MHFVQFPALSESERVAGLLPIDLMRVGHSPAEAVAASKIADVMRIRLVERSDGPVYLVSGSSAVKALRADDLGDGTVRSAQLAGILATSDVTKDVRSVDARVAVEIFSDQWTVAQQYDQYRPLYRVALEDRPGTEVYVSATTGEVVLKTTRRQRWWNYAGSVAHWIYPTALRSHPGLWAALLWWLALLAMIGAGLGAVIGTLRIDLTGRRPVSPYCGWHAWHHWLGLCCMVFVLTWIFSGWLSMDDGQIFSTGRPTTTQGRVIAGDPDWQNLPRDQLRRGDCWGSGLAEFTARPIATCLSWCQGSRVVCVRRAHLPARSLERQTAANVPLRGRSARGDERARVPSDRRS